VAPFILSLLIILAVALAVVAAFALPHLRAGSPLLTPKGEQVARDARGRLRRVGEALPDGLTARVGSAVTPALSAVRERIGAHQAAAAADAAEAGGVPDFVETFGVDGDAAPVAEPLAGPAPVPIDRQRIAPSRSTDAAAAPTARR
jgi:hypothetical protein